MMKNLKTKLPLKIKKPLLKLLKNVLNGWKVIKMLLLKNMNLKEKNLNKNSNQLWLNSMVKVDKVVECQVECQT